MEVETLDGILSVKGPVEQYGQIIYDLSLARYLGSDRLVITFGVPHHTGGRRRIQATLDSKLVNPASFILSTRTHAELKGTCLEKLHTDYVVNWKQLLWLPVPFTSELYLDGVPEHIETEIISTAQNMIKTAKELRGNNIFSDGLEALDY